MQELPPALRNSTLSVGLLVLGVAVYWPSTLALWDFWTDDNHSGAHGPLVAVLSVWLLFRARQRLAAARVRPAPWAGVLLLLCSVAWLVFWRAGIQELHILLLPVLLGLAVFTALGFEAALQIALPIGFLYFAVPAWGIFIHPLQELTIRAVGVFAPLIGVPAQIHGDLVNLPGVGVFEIAGGCSGVNFLTVGLAVAVLLGEVENASLARRGLLVGVMAVLAILSNWIRVLIIIQAGYTTQMRHVLVSRGHYMFGWMLFTVVIVAFVWAFSRSQGTSGPEPAVPRVAAPAVGAWGYGVAVVALVAMPLAIYTVAMSLDPVAAPLAFAPPAGHAGWEGPESSAGAAWRPDFVGPHAQWHFGYRGPAGRSVETVAIGYATQAQGRELVSSENSLFGAAKESALTESKVELGKSFYIETVTSDAQGHRSIVWSVYDIGGRQFATPLLSQLWYGVRSFGGPPYSVLFAFRAACEGSCDAARESLRSFVTTMGPDFFASVTRESHPLHSLRPA
jgi:EpsI family protein